MSSRSLPNVLVMMATYNGGRYVCDQLDSILAQRDVSVDVLICDDQSMDDTVALLERYTCKFQNVKVEINTENVGPGMNFMKMVYAANPNEYDYFAFADQDDIWLPDKLSVAIQSIEAKKSSEAIREVKGFGTPCLYCSDVINVDANLDNPRQELARIKPNLDKRGNPLMRNWYSGCTMVFNADMLRLVQHHPVDYVPRLHDTWMFLLAFYCGNLIVDSEHVEILRRITGNNVTGENASGDIDVYRSKIQNLAKTPSRNMTTVAQQLLEGYRSFMSRDDWDFTYQVATYASTMFGRFRMAGSSDIHQPTLLADLFLRTKLLLGRL